MDQRDEQGSHQGDQGDDGDQQAQERQQDQEERERDPGRQRIHQGHTEVEPEPGVTAGLDHFTEEEKREEPAGVMPGAAPDQEPGSDTDRLPSDKGAPGDPTENER